MCVPAVRSAPAAHDFFSACRKPLLDELRPAVYSEASFIEKIFQQACEDHHTVDIWAMYLDFVLGSREPQAKSRTPRMSDGACRSALENAVSHVGLDVRNGKRIWDKFLRFEIGILDPLLAEAESDSEDGSSSEDETPDREQDSSTTPPDMSSSGRTGTGADVQVGSRTPTKALTPTNGSATSVALKQQILVQIEKVRNVQKRLLSVPHQGLPATRQRAAQLERQFQTFVTKEDGESFARAADAIAARSSKRLRLLEHHETRIERLNDQKAATGEIETAWVQYANFVKTKGGIDGQGDPTLAKYTFNRAAASLCGSTAIWLEFVQFLINDVKDSAAAQEVLFRAVRACPQSAHLWSLLLGVLSMNNASPEVLQQIESRATVCVREALSDTGVLKPAPFVFIKSSYCAAQRRLFEHRCHHAADDLEMVAERWAKQVRKSFTSGISWLLGEFPRNKSGARSLIQQWSAAENMFTHHLVSYASNSKSLAPVIELVQGEIVGAGTELFDSLSARQKSDGWVWLAVAQVFANVGAVHAASRVFANALTVAGHQHHLLIAQEWVRHELDNGSFSSQNAAQIELAHCQSKVDQAAKNENDATATVSGAAAWKAHFAHKAQDAAAHGAEKSSQVEALKVATKRSASGMGKTSSTGAAAKRTRIDLDATIRNRSLQRDNGEFTPKTPGRSIQPSAQPLGESDTAALQTAVDGDPVEVLFLKNINFQESELELQNFFKDFETPPPAVLLITNKRGRSRGFAYVRFRSPKVLDDVLAHKVLTLHGRDMLCERKKVQPDFFESRRYVQEKSTRARDTLLQPGEPKLHPTTVFARGDPAMAWTDEELKAAFRTFGTVDAVRILKKAGSALVQFSSPESATAALNTKVCVAGRDVVCQPSKFPAVIAPTAKYARTTKPVLMRPRCLTRPLSSLRKHSLPKKSGDLQPIPRPRIPKTKQTGKTNDYFAKLMAGSK